MENRIKKLREEEEKAVKKIQETIARTEEFERVKEYKEMHRERVDKHREDVVRKREEDRRMNLEMRTQREARLKEAQDSQKRKKQSLKEDIDEIMR